MAQSRTGILLLGISIQTCPKASSKLVPMRAQVYGVSLGPIAVFDKTKRDEKLYFLRF